MRNLKDFTESCLIQASSLMQSCIPPLLFSFSESSSIKRYALYLQIHQLNPLNHKLLKKSSDLKTGSTVRLPLATIIESLFLTLKQSSLNFTLSDSPLSMFTARCLCRSSQMLIHQAHRERGFCSYLLCDLLRDSCLNPKNIIEFVPCLRVIK
ncbi:unnamed protein product [Brassica napus]|uniref:(rape) hypothetical protein n=1 Tax=Brassica napus TaxID=3708 RepID=A0A816J8Y0_BRANA|nr:unnamed protein product [Brassica napus]